MEQDDVVTISDDSDVEFVKSVDKNSDVEVVEECYYVPPANENVASDTIDIPGDLENLSQEELDDYLNSVKEQINNYNRDCEEPDQIFVESEVEVVADFKNHHSEPKEKDENPDDDDDDDDDDNVVVIINSEAIESNRLKRRIIPEPGKRKLRKKSDPKSTHPKNRLTPRITSKTPVSSKLVEEKTLPSTFTRVKKVIADPYVEEELASMTGLDDYLVKSNRRSLSDKSIVKRKTKPVEKLISEEKMETKLPEIENIPPSVTSSLRRTLQLTANTPEEKFKVLDARDKLYKIMRDRDPAGKRGALLGTCPDMCPEKERLMREFQFQVSIFEMKNYPKNTALDHKLAVKQYSRSSADQEEPLPHELRPVNVLTMTMNYLLHNIVDFCELSDDNAEEWYQFMWDRTRALRKELTQQGIHNVETVTLVEQCARFHIHCAERLVDQDSAIYDDKINTENLTKCLQTLKYMYKDLANVDVFCQNEPEFICYSLLLNLNNTSVFTELSDVSERVMMSAAVRFALDIMAAWETRNYIRFFNLVKRTTYLNCCLLRRYFNEMRLHAIKTMIRSYCTKNYSPQMAITHFVENLNFEQEEECREFLEHCSFQVYNQDGVATVNFDRLSFQNPETLFPPSRAFIFIESKKREPLSVVMAGGILPPKSYENHVPQNSFTSEGELILDPVLSKDLVDSANMPPPLLISKVSEPKRDAGKTSAPPAASIFHELLAKAQKPTTRDPRLKSNPDAGRIPSFPTVDEKEKPSNAFNNSSSLIFKSKSDSFFGQKPENSYNQKPDSVFVQKPDTNPFSQKSESIFGPKPETNLFQKPNAIFGQRPEASTGQKPSDLIFNQKSDPKPIFGQDVKPSSNNIFGQIQPNSDFPPKQDSIFNKTAKPISPIFGPNYLKSSENIFANTEKGIFPNEKSSIFAKPEEQKGFTFATPLSSVEESSKNIFGKVEKNVFDKPLFSNEPPKPVFTSSSNNFSKFSFRDAISVKSDVKPAGVPSNPTLFSNFQFKPPVNYEEEKRKEELAKKEKLERERQESERKRREEEKRKRIKEEERIRREEEERKRSEMERKRKLEEEKIEREQREREKRKEEERRRKLEMERREREERLRREELERQERIRQAERERLEEIRKAEALKRQIETAQRLQMEAKMKSLREKYQNWKMKIWFEKWRMKTWNLIEGKKMRNYSEELKIKYPPVCSEEMLNGNPYGLVIPSVLVLQSYHRSQKNVKKVSPKKMMVRDLPVLKVPRIVANLLEKSVKKLYSKEYSPFPWKLVLSVPDEFETTDSWKYIETFVEMHFVDNFKWEFGKQAGPLFYGEYGHNAFRFNVSVRRVRGFNLCEGEKSNPDAVAGSNGLIFLMTDEEGSVRNARNRLKNVLVSRQPLPQIPVVIFLLGNKLNEHVKENLNLDDWCRTHISEYRIITSDGNSQEELGSKLMESVKVLAEKTSPVSPFRNSTLCNFFSNSAFFNSVWRRIETSLSNFKITLKDPTFLIEYYNTCIERLGELFLDDSHEDYTLIGDEFRNDFKLFNGGKRPVIDENYSMSLVNQLEFLKLPHWPKEIPKSSHQLNYRIHQYCKKIAEQEKPRVKNVKWVLYRIIRRSLLWKGLDIYCDEDINDILTNFPWVQVFQELSRALLRRFVEKLNPENDLTVIYDVNKIEQLSFESSLIGKFLNKSKGKSNISKLETPTGSNPHLENDSIIYAYTFAIEKETSKRKRDSMEDENLDLIFGTPANKVQILEEEGKEPTTSNGYSDLKMDFQTISDKLDEIKKRMEENRKMIVETQNLLQ